MNEKVYEYDAVIQHSTIGKGGAYVLFPYDVREEFGKGRVKVHATFDSESYDGSVVNMGLKNTNGSVCYIIGILKDIRNKIGKQPGDTVKVTIREMQVVSGAMGKEKVHYEAIKPDLVKSEMEKFLHWFNTDFSVDAIIKAAIAHFWFIIIHPFDDGNGRITRTISDMQLARAEKSPQRYYSLSSQILVEKKQYYEVLQKVQHSDGDITEWLQFFLICMKNALLASENAIAQILEKAKFWAIHENTAINERQRLIINKLFDGFEGKLQSSKWAKICKCSQDTAIRDIKDLIEKGILKQKQRGGRSTNYELKQTPDSQRAVSRNGGSNPAGNIV